MRLGAHVGISKGLLAGLAAAEQIGCEALQVFSSNPNSWRVSELKEDVAEAFRVEKSKLGIAPVVLHTPYLLNLASPNEVNWNKSRENLTSALQRAERLDAEYVVTHIGSHGGSGFEAGAEKVALAVRQAIAGSPGSAVVLLEAGSGAGNTIGSTFDELAAILALLEDCRERVGVCLDTAHMYGAGYDISSPAKVESVFNAFDDLAGLSTLKIVHLNDTQKDLGSRADRHWHIGLGNIGLDAFEAIINHPKLTCISGILETPGAEEGRHKINLDTLKRLRA